MAGFKRTSGRDSSSEARVISSITVAAGDLLMTSRTAGTLVLATSSATVALLSGSAGIADEAATSSDTSIDVTQIDYNTVYEVDAANNSNVSHNYMRMALTDENTVNNSGTDDATNGVVEQVGVVGAAADKKILVKFLRALT